MNSEWRDMAAYVARLERERDELRAALHSIADHPDEFGDIEDNGTMVCHMAAKAAAALSSGAGTESGE